MRLSLQGWPLRGDKAWVALCSLIAIGEVGILLIAARYGFDFTDEGFYLNSITRDHEGSTHLSSFGRVFRVIAFPFDGDVVALRWFNILAVLVGGSVLGWALSSRFKEAERHGVVAVAVAASTLGFFGTGLLTPSYNSLAAIGVLMVASGLVLACGDEPGRGHTCAAVLLVGLGGLTTLLGKPSAAMAVAVVASVCLLATGATGRRVAAAAAAIAGLGLLMTSWAMTGSPVGLANELQQAVEDARALEAGHDLASAMAEFGLPRMSGRAVLMSLALATATFGWVRGWHSSERSKVGWLLVSAAATSLAAYSFIEAVEVVSFASPTRALAIMGAPAGLLLAGLTTGRRPDRKAWVLTVSLCVLPHAWIFGSNNDYWHGGSLLYVLWFASGIVLLQVPTSAPAASRVAIPPPMVLLTAVVIASMLANPYRQLVPSFDQDTPTRVGPSATLRLPPDTARAINGFREAAGFAPGTPVIDLTGQMPGLIFAIEGRAAGAPWIIGGYPGSDAVARRTLSRTSCFILARAWLIREPDGIRQIDSTVLTVVGASLDDWAPVVSEAISTTRNVDRRITLLQPIGSAEQRQASCESAKDPEPT